jgi:hypothetical protein
MKRKEEKSQRKLLKERRTRKDNYERIFPACIEVLSLKCISQYREKEAKRRIQNKNQCYFKKEKQ